ncbi:hypothetical protein HELRODRAFT_110871 [Helobdella robusta]|uniref:C2H2-type domain-containing protein n=1 Tax=Helobdella robusta TaxID=6412 RepID=T1EF59_HELRO|nr:hypothetical protein HELRODRAFT_110871 [Helobdella robusta]ESO06795.1 hypothetical protein HELRODRAFT_110871 [Helobdella robusta]
MVNGLPENRWKRLVLMASKKDLNEKKAFNSSENCKVNATIKPLKKKYGCLKRKAVKNKDEMFECEICHKTYTTAYYLRIHAKWHKLTNPKSCSYCTKRFDDDSELHEHLMLHAKDYPHKCSTCDKMFKKKVYLKCHMRLHTGEKPYKCKFCDKGFRVCSSLADHLKVHTGKRPYQCSFCNKKFAQRANWITHEKRHMGCKEFFCENCKKGFIQNFELQTHRLRCVTKEFKYECRMCDMKFTKENPFKLHCSRHCCIICGELFHNMREKVLHQVRCRRNGKTNTTKKPSTKLKGRAAALYKEFEMISSDDDDDEDEEDDDSMT